MTDTDAKQQNDALQTPFVLALDVGTSSTRALLFDATGEPVPDIVSQHTYQLTTTHEGEVSVDADMLVNEVAQTIDEVLKAAGPRAQQIGAVAIDTFWHGLMGVDAAGHHPAMRRAKFMRHAQHAVTTHPGLVLGHAAVAPIPMQRAGGMTISRCTNAAC